MTMGRYEFAENLLGVGADRVGDLNQSHHANVRSVALDRGVPALLDPESLGDIGLSQFLANASVSDGIAQWLLSCTPAPWRFFLLFHANPRSNHDATTASDYPAPKVVTNDCDFLWAISTGHFGRFARRTKPTDAPESNQTLIRGRVCPGPDQGTSPTITPEPYTNLSEAARA
jgi:hypothetical protein